MPRPTNTNPKSVSSSVTFTTVGGVPDTWIPDMLDSLIFSRMDTLPSSIEVMCIPVVARFDEHWIPIWLR